MLLSVLKIAAFLAAALSTVLAAGYVYESVAHSREVARHPPPGTLVDVDGRKIHILCKGGGRGPTVVIEPGAAEPSMLWWSIQDAVAGFARVCTYDRAGYQWSDPAPEARSISDRAKELRRVLAMAGVPGPYILVAHSYGGAIVRAWAREDGGDIAGFVFVDAPDELALFGSRYAGVVARGRWVLPLAAFAMRCGVFRALAAFGGEGGEEPPLSAEARRNWPMAFTPAGLDAARDDLASIAEAPVGERAPLAPGALGDVPLVVIAHGIPFPSMFAELEPGFRESQERLAALSRRGELVIAERSNHNINMDQPEIVVDAIRRVFSASASR